MRRQPNIGMARQFLHRERVRTAVQQKGDGYVPDNIAM
jgi:hypothetical protein